MLFCGAEVALLEAMLENDSYREVVGGFWPEQAEVFFHRPHQNGRDLGNNLEVIKDELRNIIRTCGVQVVFLSLGGGAKILCYELAQELGICAIDFGSFIRSLTYSGSPGNKAGRATHLIYLFRIPFALYMSALEKVEPSISRLELIARAHAQLLLELQKKERGWSHAAWEYDFSAQNLEHFHESLDEYKKRYRHLFRSCGRVRKERADFLHFCGTHRLTTEGRLFLALFEAKGILRRLLLPSRNEGVACRSL